ncbi:MFS transporter [Flavobacteriaceae bacterium GF1]
MTNAIRAIYFFFHVGLGCVFAFLVPYLGAEGFSDAEISSIFFLGSLCGAIGVPLFWGYLSDRVGKPQLVVKILTLGTLIGSIPLLFLKDYWPFLISYFVYSFFSIGIMGILDAMASTLAKEKGIDFGRLRLFVPAGWFLGSILMGAYLEYFEKAWNDVAVIAGMVISFSLMFLASLFLKKSTIENQERPKTKDMLALFKDKGLMVFFLMAFLNFIALAAYMGNYSQLIKAAGHGAFVVSMAFAVATLSEVIFMLLFERLKNWIGIYWVIISSVLISIIRWLIVANTTDANVLVGIQVLHSEIGLFTLACVSLITDSVPKKIVTTAQTLFYTLTYGLGLFLGGILMGAIGDTTYNGYRNMFLISALLHVIPLFLCFVVKRMALAKNLTEPLNYD